MLQRSPRIVYIIDDEPSVRQALVRLCRSAGVAAESFPGVEEFLSSEHDTEGACIVCDVRMAGASGLELPPKLVGMNPRPPVIFLTAFDTPEARAEAREAGAAAFFRKPVNDQALLDAIEWALSDSLDSSSSQTPPTGQTQ